MDLDAYLWQSLKRLWRAPCVILGLGLAFLGCTPAQAQRVTDTGSASAVVVAPLSLTSNQALNFGRIAAGNAAGTVVLSPTTLVCTPTGPIKRIGTCQPAEFTGMGAMGMALRIGLPTNVILTRTKGGATMAINALTIGSTSSLASVFAGAWWRIQSSSGIFNFRVGGTLVVGANQPSGVYNGSFVVLVQYQ